MPFRINPPIHLCPPPPAAATSDTPPDPLELCSCATLELPSLESLPTAPDTSLMLASSSSISSSSSLSETQLLSHHPDPALARPSFPRSPLPRDPLQPCPVKPVPPQLLLLDPILHLLPPAQLPDVLLALCDRHACVHPRDPFKQLRDAKLLGWIQPRGADSMSAFDIGPKLDPESGLPYRVCMMTASLGLSCCSMSV